MAGVSCGRGLVWPGSRVAGVCLAFCVSLCCRGLVCHGFCASGVCMVSRSVVRPSGGGRFQRAGYKKLRKQRSACNFPWLRMPATVATAEVSIGTTGQQNGSVHLCADGSSPLLEPRTIGKPSAAAAKRSSSTAGAGATPKQQISYMHSSSVYPALLVFLCPFFVMLFSYTIVKLDGSPTALLQEIRRKGIGRILYSAWVPYIFGSTKAWKFILPYALFQLALMKILPGKLTKGPITPAGNIPIYRANGMLAYLVTLTTYFVCAYILKLFNPADIYDHYLEFIGAMNVLSLIFCFGIYLKGRLIPSTTDCGASGNFIFDYYWGTELYPRVLDWDIKMFTNCRFGMMGWPLLILSYAAKQYATHGLSDSMIVAVALQLIYITKFFHWEMGYMKSLDIMHDRAGFYLVSGSNTN